MIVRSDRSHNPHALHLSLNLLSLNPQLYITLLAVSSLRPTIEAEIKISRHQSDVTHRLRLGYLGPEKEDVTADLPTRYRAAALGFNAELEATLVSILNGGEPGWNLPLKLVLNDVTIGSPPLSHLAQGCSFSCSTFPQRRLPPYDQL